jgi:N-acetyl-gamma-glutamyl-phosphate reductase
MSKPKIGIINVTGYAGMELARLLHQHSGVELTSVTGRGAAGQKLGAVLPHLADIDLAIYPELGKVDFVFSAMPHKDSAEAVIPLLDKGIKVVDISADFRIKKPGEYEKWYGLNHPAPALLEKSVYGLPELHRSEVTSASLVANPGCYPTGAILAIAPAVKAGIFESYIVIDSKSGVSGAGRALSLHTHYCEADEDVAAYAIGGHRHFPEIIQELELLCPGELPPTTFVPHRRDCFWCERTDRTKTALSGLL